MQIRPPTACLPEAEAGVYNTVFAASGSASDALNDSGTSGSEVKTVPRLVIDTSPETLNSTASGSASDGEGEQLKSAFSVSSKSESDNELQSGKSLKHKISNLFNKTKSLVSLFNSPNTEEEPTKIITKEPSNFITKEPTKFIFKNSDRPLPPGVKYSDEAVAKSIKLYKKRFE